MKSPPNPYAGFRFPAEIISHALWLYHRFTLSLREIEEILAERGIIVSDESIRQGCLKFGSQYAGELPRRRPQPGNKWHLDEVRIVINGKVYWLWRAVDQNNQTLDILMQKRRNKRAAKRFLKKLLKGLCDPPRVIISDKLRRYGAARKAILPGVGHCQHKGLNNQAEVSHQPTCQQECQMRGFKSPAQAQRFLCVHAPANNLFRARRYRMNASEYRAARSQAFETWQQLTCAQSAS